MTARQSRVLVRRITIAAITACACQGSKATGPGPTATIRTVTVTPGVDTLSIHASVQLTVAAKDSSGQPVSGATFTWASEDSSIASVSSTGMVSAQAVGATHIAATSNGTVGSALIVVTAATPAPTILMSEGFEDTAFATRGWYDNSHLTVTDTEHFGGSHALEVHFTAGAITPTFGGAARHLFTLTPTIYLSYWVKYSANWVGSGVSYHPHEFYFLTNEDGASTGPSFTHLTLYVEHNYNSGGYPALQLQDASNIDQTKIGVDLTDSTELRAAQGCNGNTDGYPTGCYDQGGGTYNNQKVWKTAAPAFEPNPGPGYKGDWNHVEALFQLNSTVSGKGVADGIVRYWFNGQLVIEHTDVLLRTGAHTTMQFNQLLIGPYIGVGSPVDQVAWIDSLVVATGKP